MTGCALGGGGLYALEEQTELNMRLCVLCLELWSNRAGFALLTLHDTLVYKPGHDRKAAHSLQGPTTLHPTMKLLVLFGLLAALMISAEGSGLPPCEPYQQPGQYCPYPPQHECGVYQKTCRYNEVCCRGPCHNECRPSQNNYGNSG